MRPRVAIVSECMDWGGTERVIQVAADLYPDAPVVAGDFERLVGPGVGELPWFARAHRVPVGGRKLHFLAPLYSRRLAAAGIGEADVVLAFHHAGWGAGVAVPPGARMVCFAAGVPKYLYGETDRYLSRYPLPVRAPVRAAVPALRRHNRKLLSRAHALLAPSRASAAGLERFHGLRAEVVHPPVRTSFFTPGPARRGHALAVARAVPHKRLEVLVEAFRSLDEQLVVVGHGNAIPKLRAQAPPNVRFTGFVPDEELRELYRGAFVLLSPSVEEFGLVMAEAQACGTPVISPAAGGALEIVDDPATGILLANLQADTLADAVRSARRGGFDAEACRASAERFSEERFAAEMERIVEREWARTAAGRASAADLELA
jgi:glycosyltransferase involved in cell wall biosynthesis